MGTDGILSEAKDLLSPSSRSIGLTLTFHGTALARVLTTLGEI